MAPEVRLIGPDNEQLGVVSLAEALRMAGDADVDLVEVVANATPPVCRVQVSSTVARPSSTAVTVPAQVRTSSGQTCSRNRTV